MTLQDTLDCIDTARYYSASEIADKRLIFSPLWKGGTRIRNRKKIMEKLRKCGYKSRFLTLAQKKLMQDLGFPPAKYLQSGIWISGEELIELNKNLNS